MTVAMMKALHSPIPLIDDLFASLPPNNFHHAPPLLVAHNRIQNSTMFIQYNAQ